MRAIYSEGVKNIAPRYDRMDLRRVLQQAVEYVKMYCSDADRKSDIGPGRIGNFDNGHTCSDLVSSPNSGQFMVGRKKTVNW
jgi:hypothetical protein